LFFSESELLTDFLSSCLASFPTFEFFFAFALSGGGITVYETFFEGAAELGLFLISGTSFFASGLLIC